MKFSKKHTAFISVLLVLAMPCAPAFAADKDTKTILNQFGFESNNPVKNVIRSFGWSFVTGLQWLVSGLESTIYSINSTLGGFFTSAPIRQLGSDKVIPIALALIGVVVLFVGIASIVKPREFTTIFSNFIVGVTIAIALPTLLSVAYNFTSQTISFISGDASGKMQKLSDRVLLDNVVDMTRYDTEGFKSINLKYKSYYATPGAPGGKITTINPTETVDPENMKNKEVWKNRVVTDQDGKQTLQELNSGNIGFINVPMMSEYYYRWKIDWLNIISTLLITGIALILSGIKIARLLYELAIHQLATQVIALLDVMTAQRLKRCLQTLFATFVTLISVFLMLQIYLIGMDYISNVTNIPLKLILMVALAWSVIDGPNLFEQLFGVDAGLHGAMQTIYGLKAAGGAVVGGAAMLGGRNLIEKVKAKGVIGAAGSAVGAASRVAGGAGGIAAGLASGMADNVRRVHAARNGHGVSGQDSEQEQSGKEKNQSPASGQNQKQPKRPESQTASAGSENAQTSPATGAAVGAAANSKSNSARPPAATETADTSTGGSANGPAARQTRQNQEEKTFRRQSAAKGASYSDKTLGGFIKSNVNRSAPVASARHLYSLTRSSMQARGNKLVDRENKIREIQSGNPEISRYDAKRQAKRQIKAERNIK